jgi:DNA polymerase-1
MIPLSLDTETALIRPGVQIPELACVAIQSRGLGVRELLHWTECRQAVEWVLTQPDVLIFGHTIAYDMAVFAAHFPDLLPLIFAAYNANRITCTEVRAKLLDIATGQRKFYTDEDEGAKKSGYSLELLAERFLNRTLDKNTWRLKYGELRNFPIALWPAGARKYPLDDTGATEDLFWIQEQSADLLVDQFRQARAAFWIKLMAAWGLRTDVQGVRALAERTRQEYESIAKDLRTAGLLWGVRPKGAKNWGKAGSRNVKAVRERVRTAYARMGKSPPQTKGGDTCADGQTCEDSGDDVLIKYSQYASLGKVLSTDIPLLEGGLTCPIHSKFDSCKDSGRTGSSHPNVQNQSRKGGVRECFVPRCLTCGRVHTSEDVVRAHCLCCGQPPTVFISCDYSGAELCAHGQVNLTLIGWSALADAMNAGQDPHLMIAAQILGRLYPDVKAEYDQDPRPANWDKLDELRQLGKIANFGFQGGLGAKGLVAFALSMFGIRLTEEQAASLKKTWLATWPEMADYFRMINRAVNQNRPQVTQLFSGRVRGFSGLRAYTEACNTMFQGLAADMAKAAGWYIIQACFDPSSPLYGCRIVNFVHDEFILEAPEDRAHEAALELSRLMIKAAGEWLPQVRIAAKPQVMRRWSKKAKPVWKNGRLVPWDLKVAA